MSYLLPDYHVHTCFSGDSDTPVESMLKRAISLSVPELCITDHIDFEFPEEPDLFFFDTESYFYTLTKLKQQYKNQISLKIGVELGLQPHLAESNQAFIKELPFDFVIASSHLVDHMDPYYASYWEGGTPKSKIQRYFESILENLQVFSDFDVYGHLDYVVRYCTDKAFLYQCEDYQDIWEECLRILIANGKGIELNCAGFRYGKYPNPHQTILRRYKELGGEILTIGSDAHSPEYLAFHFPALPELLKSCGFSYITTFENRKPTFMSF